jgi:hypothetical protein
VRIDAYQLDRGFNERDVVKNVGAAIPLSRTTVGQIKAIKGWCYKRHQRVATRGARLAQHWSILLRTRARMANESAVLLGKHPHDYGCRSNHVPD